MLKIDRIGMKLGIHIMGIKYSVAAVYEKRHHPISFRGILPDFEYVKHKSLQAI